MENDRGTDSSTSYTSFEPLTSETSGSGFSFLRWFRNRGKTSGPPKPLSEENEEYPDCPDVSWPEEQRDASIRASSTGLEENTYVNNHGGKKLPHSPGSSTVIPKITVSKTKSENNTPTVARKEKSRYRNVKTILRRLSAIAVDRRWRQVNL